MKSIRIVFASIFLLIMLLPYQTGLSLAYGKSSASVVRHDPVGNTNWLPIVSNPAAPALGAQTGTCHFGITVPLGLDGYDLSTIGVDSYLDWGFHKRNVTVADNIQYYRVVQVSDSAFAANMASLPALLTANPGAVWIIGNEPDAEVIYQDHISAETYAEHFYDMATLIRTDDPTAMIGFGSVIQPTPVRLHYLDLALARLTELAGSKPNALALIDIYTIHAFILNERPLTTPNCGDCWGAGVPVGYVANTWPAPEIIIGNQTYDINLFVSRVTAFRQWMKVNGQQTKPLWITEYGSLFPTWLNVSELTSATYMDQTFDYMLGTRDSALGYSADDNRLVQKWLWYSLNENVDNFGGSLYNPLTHELTTVGEHFISYNPSETAVPVTNPDVYIQAGNPVIGPGPIGNYAVSFKILNNVSSDRSTPVKVELFLGSTLVGSVNMNLPRCAGRLPVSFYLDNLVAGQNYTFTARVSLTSMGQTDINPSNNEITFQSIAPILYAMMAPIITR